MKKVELDDGGEDDDQEFPEKAEVETTQERQRLQVADQYVEVRNGFDID